MASSYGLSKITGTCTGSSLRSTISVGIGKKVYITTSSQHSYHQRLLAPVVEQYRTSLLSNNTTYLYSCQSIDDNERQRNTSYSNNGLNYVGIRNLCIISNSNRKTDNWQQQQQQQQLPYYNLSIAAKTITPIRHASTESPPPPPTTTPPPAAPALSTPASTSPTSTTTTTTTTTTIEKKRVPKSRMSSVRVRMQAANAKYKKPTLEIADKMPLSIQEMDNISLVTMAAMNSSKAHVEMLKRHIMSVDRLKYDDACLKFNEIQLANNQYLWLIALPYRIGIISGASAAIISVPMVFYFPLADWFNKGYVTTSIPPPEDIETILEVGAWTWSWCEPALGTVSFVLLALQFARAQIQNLGNKPYTAFVKQRRGERLASMYPKYDANLIINYSKSTGFSRV